MYEKTGYRLKCRGKLSPKVLNDRGVNQGGCASDILFRRYLADVSDYLTSHSGVCLGDMIMLHLLWADDLILVTEEIDGMQKQLDGLAEFGKENQAIVNDTKTKIMGIGTGDEKIKVHFQGKQIEQVTAYKYVGNIMSQINNIRGDVFSGNYPYLCNKGKSATYAMFRKVRNLGALPPRIMIYMFDTMIKPILMYGSDVWGVQKQGTDAVDKVFQWFLKWILKVKTTTSTTIVYGEVGCTPLSVFCHVNVMNYYARLYNLPDSMLVKQAFNSLLSLTEQGFTTWIKKVWDLARKYNINLHCTNYKKACFNSQCKVTIRDIYISEWHRKLQNVEQNPIFRTYTTIKNDFDREPYLDHVKDFRYRNAITKLRASSHNLEVERGRHQKPKIPLCERLCRICNMVEDEAHFLIDCEMYQETRSVFFSKVSALDPMFSSLDRGAKFTYLMKSHSPRILVLLGKFVYSSFQERESKLKSIR